MKYIDAERLKAEIRHLKIDVYDEAHQFDTGARSSLKFLESFIDSLQQEQPEVDLEMDAVQFCFDKGLNVTPYQAKTIAHLSSVLKFMFLRILMT